MFIFLALLFVSDCQSYPKTVERVWDLTNTYTTQKRISWGINYEGIYNKERLWVKENLKYDFYDVSSATVGSNLVATNPFPTRTTGCKNTGTFLLDGNKFMSIHGNDQYCTCTWSASNPCPHKLQISGTDISYAGKYQFFTNTVLPVDRVDPDVDATYGMAQPFEACETITNPEEIAGKWCVVYRGACFFQTKWEMCHAAGAVGTILVTLDDSTGAGWAMWVESISTPMVGISNSLGTQMNATWFSGKRDVRLRLGKGTGVDEPDPAYSSPEPLVTINYYTGEATEDAASHFTTVQDLIYNSKTDMAHFVGVNGVGADIQVYDMDQSPPNYMGEYTVGIDGYYGFIYNEPNSGKPAVIMYALDAWDGRVSFFDMTDELNPAAYGSIEYQPCDDSDSVGDIVLHPSNRFIYLIPIINQGSCNYNIRLYDISSLPTATKIADIHIPEVDQGADIYSMNFGTNNIAAISLSSAGVSWYDFSDPTNPSPVAHLDISEIENTYTQGVRGTRQSPSDPNVWIIQDETEFWHNFHAVRLKDLSPQPPSNIITGTQGYPKAIERIWDLTSQYTTAKYISWGVNYEGIYNKERLWVKEGLQYDFYDVTSAAVGSNLVKTNPFQARSSGCKNAASFLLGGNKFMSIHGNDQYCTCTWTADNPCPHKLQITGTGISYAGKYQFYTNTVLPVDQVEPDVVGTYGMAQPSEACETITNPEEIAGKWCVVYRGSCFFQTKWEMCHAAGAIGTLLVTLDDSSGAGWAMWVESISTPMIGVRNSIGESLRESWESGRRDIQIGVGKGIGVDSPDPEYSSPEPLRTMNYYTGEFTEDTASHFTTVQSLIYNTKTDMAHFIGVNGVGSDIQVYDMDQSPPQYMGDYTVDIDGNYGFIYNEPNSGKPGVIMYALDAWAGTVSFFNMENELSPSPLGSLSFEKCDPDNDFLGDAVLHPSNRFLYLIPSIHLGACEYKIRLYDISSLPTVTKIAEIHIPEVDDGADIYSVNFGVNNIAALSLSSAGVSWYDFSDPANPTAVAHLDVSEIENTYTQGVRGTRQSPSDPNVWIIQDETEFWHNFHAVRLVEVPTLSPTTAQPTRYPTNSQPTRDPTTSQPTLDPASSIPTRFPTRDAAAAAAAAAAAQANNDDDDDEKKTWQAIAIIFLVLTIICCCVAVFFFTKWNMEVAFKFHQMGEYVEETNKMGGTTITGEETP